MTPRHYMRYLQWLEHTGGHSICDGVTEPTDMVFQVLFPLFIMTGLGGFLLLYTYWEVIKEKIRGKKQ